MRYVELNSRGLQISVLYGMNNLSVNFECVLVLTSVSCLIKILLEWGIYIIYWFVLWFAQRCLANYWF